MQIPGVASVSQAYVLTSAEPLLNSDPTHLNPGSGNSVKMKISYMIIVTYGDYVGRRG